jgi:uncharacterized protein (UPF0332 family)
MGKKKSTKKSESINKSVNNSINPNIPIEIRKHLQKAQRIYRGAQYLAEQDDLDGVFSRLYYSLLHAIVGCLRGINVNLSKHKHIILLQLFRENFILTNIFPSRIYHQILDFKNLRERADYQIDEFIDIEESKDLLDQALKIINSIIDYWNQKYPSN